MRAASFWTLAMSAGCPAAAFSRLSATWKDAGQADYALRIEHARISSTICSPASDSLALSPPASSSSI